MINILPKYKPGHEVTLDGRAVPGLEVAEDAVTGDWHVVYDRRFIMHGACSLEELQRWVPLLAHAHAIGGGWSAHGANSRRVNPNNVQVSEVTSIGDRSSDDHN